MAAAGVKDKEKGLGGVKGWIQGDEEGLIRHGSIMFAASMVVNLSNYLFQIFMSRSLGNADFATMKSLVDIFMIVALPISAIQTTTANYVARLKVLGRYDQIAALFFRSMKKVLIFSAVGLAGFTIFSGAISAYLRIDDPIPVMIIGVALAIALTHPAISGILQGLQRFMYLGMVQAGGAMIRLIFGVVTVLLGYGVNGAVGASVASGIFILVVFVPLLRLFFSQDRAVEVASQEVYRYLVPVFISLGCLSVISYVDGGIVVKHYFSGEEAGIYQKAAIIGKAFLYFPAALVVVLFPKASELYTSRGRSTGLLTMTVWYSSVISVLGIGLCFLLSDFVASMIAPQLSEVEVKQISALLKYFGLAITPIALISILVNYNLAVHRMKFIYVILCGMVLYVAALFVFHNSFWEILWVMGICNWGAFVFSWGFTLIAERKAAGTGFPDSKKIRQKRPDA